MKNLHNAIRWAGRMCAVAMLASGLQQTAAQSTAFTYNGRLTGNGTPVSGPHEMQFTLYDAINGNVVAGPLPPIAVDVANGLFTVRIDFGAGVFTGAPRWLDVAVRPAGGVNFTALTPRHEVTSSPYSIRSQSAATADGGGGGGGSVWSVNGGNAYYLTGNVGVGTTTPGTRLTVAATGYGIEHTDGTRRLSSYLSATGGWLGTRSNDPLNFFVNDGGSRLTIDTGGRVGIGTTTPTARLTVRTTGAFSAYGIEHTDGDVRLSTYLDSAYGAWLGTRTSHGLNFFINDGLPSLSVDATGNVVVTPNGGTGGYGSTIFGTPNGESGLTIRGNGGGANRADLRFNGSSVKLVAGPGTGPPGFTSGVTVTTAGNVGIGTDSPAAKLDVIGTTRTCVLTITGGCDLAEPFPMKETEIEKGSVVVIDDEHPGRLKLSAQAYDKRVAGIVSGANGVNTGIALKQAGVLDQGQNVALSGRVYVQADASFGDIKPGDLLTTSDTAGHAMKVLDHAQAQGAILGKAMTGLKDGKGFVLVLVTLQ